MGTLPLPRPAVPGPRRPSSDPLVADLGRVPYLRYPPAFRRPPPTRRSTMATVTLKGAACNLAGNLPKKGDAAPAFTLVKQDLSPLSLADLKGKTTILLTVPSLD